jgi:hypothetical protein
MLRLVGLVIVYLFVWLYDIVMETYKFITGTSVDNPIMFGIFFTVNASGTCSQNHLHLAGLGNWVVYGLSNKQIREMYTFSIILLFWIAPYKLVWVICKKLYECCTSKPTPPLLRSHRDYDSDEGQSSQMIETVRPQLSS